MIVGFDCGGATYRKSGPCCSANKADDSTYFVSATHFFARHRTNSKKKNVTMTIATIINISASFDGGVNTERFGCPFNVVLGNVDDVVVVVALVVVPVLVL